MLSKKAQHMNKHRSNSVSPGNYKEAELGFCADVYPNVGLVL
jgi:hypothetical protein